MRLYSAIIILASGMFTEVLAEESQGRLLDSIAARVGEKIITVGDVLTVMGPVSERLYGGINDPAVLKQLRAAYGDALDSIVDRYLILGSAEAEKINIPDWYLDQRVEEIVRDNFGGDKARLLNVLAKDRKTFEEWRAEVREHIIVGVARNMVVDEKVKISPVAVRSAFEKNMEKYRKPAQVKLRVIVIEERDTTGALSAEAIKKEIENGADFAEMARKHSTGLKATDGGDWGWMSVSSLVKDLAVEVDSLQPGGVGRIVRIGEDCYIVKVEDRKEASNAMFEEAQQVIEKELKREESDRLYKEWIGRLKKENYVSLANIDPFK